MIFYLNFLDFFRMICLQVYRFNYISYNFSRYQFSSRKAEKLKRRVACDRSELVCIFFLHSPHMRRFRKEIFLIFLRLCITADRVFLKLIA